MTLLKMYDAPKSTSTHSDAVEPAELKKQGLSPRKPSVTQEGPYVAQLLE